MRALSLLLLSSRRARPAPVTTSLRQWQMTTPFTATQTMHPQERQQQRWSSSETVHSLRPRVKFSYDEVDADADFVAPPSAASYKSLTNHDTSKLEICRKMIYNWIGSDTVVLFTLPDYPLCELAKDALSHAGCIEYTEIDVSREQDQTAIKQLLWEMAGNKPVVPMVFIHGRYIGGGNDCQRLLDSGDLHGILKNSHHPL